MTLLIPKLISLNADDGTSIFESLREAINKIVPDDDQISDLSSIKNPRPKDNNGQKEGQFKLEPNSVYFIKVVLTPQGYLDVKYYWHNEVGKDWEHNERDSMPTDPVPAALKIAAVSEKTVAFRNNSPSLHLEELTTTKAEFNWKWVSWVVVLFENDSWQFHNSDDPIIFETSKLKNFSCFEGELISTDLTGGKRKAFAFKNFMSKDKNGTAFKDTEKASYKFNLVMSVKLAGGGELKVLVDPTGTNDGPSGGGAPP